MSGSFYATQQQQPLLRRRMEAIIALGEGSFGNSGFNTVTLRGLQMSATVIKAGGASMGSLQLHIWGMELSKMNQLSTLGKLPMTIRNNTISLKAGDDSAGLGVVFEGTIAEAWTDFQQAPDSVFHITAYSGLLAATRPIPPFTAQGSADVATIMSSLASQMGLTFENNGVTVKLQNPYFPGTAREQAQRCADAAGINWIIDNGKLAIWPKGKNRGETNVVVSPETGMIGYPTFTSTGVVVTTLYNPSLGFASKVDLKTILKPAQGVWVIYNLTHILEAEMPGGSWMTRFEAAPPGYTPVR